MLKMMIEIFKPPDPSNGLWSVMGYSVFVVTMGFLVVGSLMLLAKQ